VTVARFSGASEEARLAALAAYDVIGVAANDPIIGDLNALCELAATLLGAPTAVVNLLDDRFQHQVAAYGLDPTPCLRDEAMCQTTLAEGQDIVVRDASDDPRFVSSPWVDGRISQIRMYCSTILRTPEGHAVGTVCVFDETSSNCGCAPGSWSTRTPSSRDRKTGSPRSPDRSATT
jgi:GAF domain-containing protein